jgi:hypothetical protein
MRSPAMDAKGWLVATMPCLAWIADRLELKYIFLPFVVPIAVVV